MDVILAKSAGFCPGVKRAVNMVYEQTEKCRGREPVYTYGPIIHNDEVVRDLAAKGAEVIHSLEELDDLPRWSSVLMGLRVLSMKRLRQRGFI